MIVASTGTTVLPFILDTVVGSWCLWILGDELPDLMTRRSSLSLHSACTGQPRTVSLSQHTLSWSLADSTSQIVMPVPKSTKHHLSACSCGCNKLVTQWTKQHHKILPLQPESLAPPPSKWCRTAHFQVGQESIIRPGKQMQSRTDKNPFTFHSRTDASSSSSDNPQLHTPSFKFNPSLPWLD